VDVWIFLLTGEEKKKRRFIFAYLGDMFPSGPWDGSGPGGIGDDGNLRDVI
jgi:hypothetical protein